MNNSAQSFAQDERFGAIQDLNFDEVAAVDGAAIGLAILGVGVVIAVVGGAYLAGRSQGYC